MVDCAMATFYKIQTRKRANDIVIIPVLIQVRMAEAQQGGLERL